MLDLFRFPLTSADAPCSSSILHAQIRFDEVANIDHKEGDTHTVGSVDMKRVDYPDGTRVVKITTQGLGDNLELHWGCVFDGADGWAPPPQGASATGGINDFGDGVASRTKIGGDGVTFTFPPGVGENVERMVGIVVKGELWLHSVIGDLVIPLKTPSGTGVLKSLADGEKAQSGSLYERFRRVNDKLSEAVQAGPDGAAAVMATLRLSAMRQLPWYAGGNYQGKDMAHMQEMVASRVAEASKSAESGMARQLFRIALSTLPRGGGNGDDIRLGILQIMRDNGIKEGHRPGIEDAFIQQWHQKLHSNTTVDDIYICEAYLHFLHTGVWEDFWTYLFDNHGLTRDDLAEMKAGWRTEGIHGPAEHLPHMIDPMKHFLWILKITHGGGSMDSAMDFAHGVLPEDLQYEIRDMLDNRDAPWVPNKIVELRERLAGVWKYGPDCNRDVVLLDIAMEKFYRQRIEAMNTAGMTADDKLGGLEAAVRNVCVGGDFDRMQMALEFLRKANGPEEASGGLVRWSAEWGKAMDAALDNVALAMEHHMDELCSYAQRAAYPIGLNAEIDFAYLDNFGEEVVRGHSMFAVSKMIGEVRDEIRAAAGRSPWLIVSNGSPEISLHAGIVQVVPLADIQGQDFSSNPIVALTAKLGGLEDIPPGVTAVITASPVDLLSHIAIRARQMNVLLAAMPDPGGWAELMSMSGEGVKIDIVGEEVIVKKSELGPAAAATVAGPPTGQYIEGLTITPSANCPVWLVEPKDYADGIVGGKSKSLSNLGFSTTLSTYAMMSETMRGGDLTVPTSNAIPFGSFEKTLRADEDTLEKVAVATAAVAAADDAGDADLRRDALDVLRDIIVYRLKMPEDLKPVLQQAIVSYGGMATIEGVWRAIKKVWASKWNERAYLSRKACGVEEEELCMATLLMELVPAEYSFVLHTANPVTGNQNEVYGEVCVGLGEALVGNEPGNALSFTAQKVKGFPHNVRSLPSKPIAHVAQENTRTIIARSDSNGEDLEGFAGAGLYDSVVVDEPELKPVAYADEPLIWDAEKRSSMIRKLAELAVAIEVEMKSPQDIEGCIVGENFYILQSRPQVLH